ncbi:MAG: sulfatase [Rhodothermales bacterium]|nr:sulfatase [Rhodothermales bacterium]
MDTFTYRAHLGSVLLFSLLLVAGCSKELPAPNVVFIYIDDLGWRDVGFMGSTYYETPHLDRLASQGMVFTNAYANAPNCAPSRASLLTGLYTPRHGIYTVGTPERGEAHLRKLIPVANTTALDTSFVTFAEVLEGAGFATAHMGKWHLGGDGHLPTDQGFGLNVAGDHRGAPPAHFYPYERRGNALPDLHNGAKGEYLTDRLTDEAMRFIETHADESFFLYLAHYAVHTPIQAREVLVETFRQKPGDEAHNDPVYAAMIASVDEGVGRIMDQLDALGLAENTVVFFHSDNGGYGPATSMQPLRGSKGMLYEGGIRVPLAVRWPGRIEAGSSSDTPVIGTDIYPTLLEMADVVSPPGLELDGASLMPLLTGTASLEPRNLFWHFPAYLEAYRGTTEPWRTTPGGAVRQGDYKLVEFFEDGTLELYNLRGDIGEEVNLADEMPEKVQELRADLRAWREAVRATVPTEKNPAYVDSANATSR